MEVGPLVTDISAAQEVADLACGHRIPITGRGGMVVRRLFCGTCGKQCDVLVYRPLDASGNVVHWPSGNVVQS